MFQKKEILYSETQGVCQVENIVQLQGGKGEQVPYYVLRSLLDKEQVAYIPVENHQVQLKPIFTADEARQLKDSKEAKENPMMQQAIRYVLGEEDGEENE